MQHPAEDHFWVGLAADSRTGALLGGENEGTTAGQALEVHAGAVWPARPPRRADSWIPNAGHLLETSPRIPARYTPPRPIHRFQALLPSLARVRVSGTSKGWAGPATIQVNTAPSTSHAAPIASSPQLTTAGLGIGQTKPF